MNVLSKTLPVLGLALALCSPALAEEAEFVFVVLDSATVKAEPAHFSATVSKVKEGAKLEVLSAAEGWVEVKVKDGVQGFVRDTAVWDKKQNRNWSKILGLPKSERDTYAAQKGFGPEVETKYSKDEDLDYTEVDAMIAKPKVSDPTRELKSFRKKGSLGEFAGGKK